MNSHNTPRADSTGRSSIGQRDRYHHMPPATRSTVRSDAIYLATTVLPVAPTILVRAAGTLNPTRVPDQVRLSCIYYH